MELKEIDTTIFTTITHVLLLIITINQPIKVTIFIEGALSSFHWDPIRKTSHWQSQVVEYFLAIHL